MSLEMHAVTAVYVAKAHQLWSAAEVEYERGRDVYGYWAMYDLRRSAYYRELAGSASAFCRGETFTSILQTLLGAYDGVEIFKELGDGILVRSGNLRTIIEVTCVLDAVRRSWPGSDMRRHAPSFDFTCAVTQGEATQINRMGIPDYLGAPIDRVARLSGFRSADERQLVLLEGEVARESAAKLVQEYPFLAVLPAELLEPALQKAGEAPMRFNQVSIDRAGFDGFRRFFQPLRPKNN